jgi:hypothetical protein
MACINVGLFMLIIINRFFATKIDLKLFYYFYAYFSKEFDVYHEELFLLHGYISTADRSLGYTTCTE